MEENVHSARVAKTSYGYKDVISGYVTKDVDDLTNYTDTDTAQAELETKAPASAVPAHGTITSGNTGYISGGDYYNMVGNLPVVPLPFGYLRRYKKMSVDPDHFVHLEDEDSIYNFDIHTFNTEMFITGVTNNLVNNPGNIYSQVVGKKNIKLIVYVGYNRAMDNYNFYLMNIYGESIYSEQFSTAGAIYGKFGIDARLIDTRDNADAYMYYETSIVPYKDPDDYEEVLLNATKLNALCNNHALNYTMDGVTYHKACVTEVELINLGSTKRINDNFLCNFYCLEHVSIPEGITYLGNNALNECRMLQGPVTLPNSITNTYPVGVLNHCDSLYGPDNVVTLPDAWSQSYEPYSYECVLGCDSSTGAQYTTGTYIKGYEKTAAQLRTDWPDFSNMAYRKLIITQ